MGDDYKKDQQESRKRLRMGYSVTGHFDRNSRQAKEARHQRKMESRRELRQMKRENGGKRIQNHG